MKTKSYSLINFLLVFSMILFTKCSEKVFDDTCTLPNLDKNEMSIDEANGIFASILARAISTMMLKTL